MLLLEKPQLIIFDKDGTLFGSNNAWKQWLDGMVSRCEAAMAEANPGAADGLKDRLFRLMGLSGGDDIACELSAESPLATDTWASLRGLVVGELVRCQADQGRPAEEWGEAVRAWHVEISMDREHDPLFDVPALFADLKARGIKVAIATADDRAATEEVVRVHNLGDLVDLIVCGDDPLQPKPHPEVATHICERLGCDLAKTVMVGDTLADMGLGRAAKLGLTIGVLSGSGSAAQLGESADILLDHGGRLQAVAVRAKW